MVKQCQQGGSAQRSISNVIVHDDLHAESINLHETQGLMPSQSEVNDSASPPTDIAPEQNYDVDNASDVFSNMQSFNELRVSSRERMQKLSKRSKDIIESGFNHDRIAFKSTYETDYDLTLELEEKMCGTIAFVTVTLCIFIRLCSKRTLTNL